MESEVLSLANEKLKGTEYSATKVVLSKAGENMYKGMITFSFGEECLLNVTCDGENLVYEIPELIYE